jgi:hypothetical protein
MTEAQLLDLYRWPLGRPSNVVDAMPALIRKAAMETAYQIPRPKGDAVVTEMRRIA